MANTRKLTSMANAVGSNGVLQPQTVTIGGARAVILDESEYRRLMELADEWMPPLPAPNERGNYPALETMRAITAREMIQRRRNLGWTQAEFAQRAGVKPATVRRIESGNYPPSVAAVDRMDRVLQKAEKSRQSRQTKPRTKAIKA